LSLRYNRYLGNRFFAIAQGGLDRNTELGIDLRSSIAGGGGRQLKQTNRSMFRVIGALSVNREIPFEGSTTNNIEAIGTLAYSLFRYDRPEIDFSTDLSLIPSLTQSGRYRSNYNLRLRQEIIKDLFWDLSIYYSFDSDPPSTAASNSDYGVVLSVGYSF
jgi:hypothetical protein